MEKIKEFMKQKLAFVLVKDTDRMISKINMCIKALAVYSVKCNDADQLELISETIRDLSSFKSQLKE